MCRKNDKVDFSTLIMKKNLQLKKITLFVGVINLVYFFVEFSFALKINSVSIFADSIDFLEDAFWGLDFGKGDPEKPQKKSSATYILNDCITFAKPDQYYICRNRSFFAGLSELTPLVTRSRRWRMKKYAIERHLTRG